MKQTRTLASLLNRWSGALNNEDHVAAEEAEDDVMAFLSQRDEVNDDEATTRDEEFEATDSVAQLRDQPLRRAVPTTRLSGGSRERTVHVPAGHQSGQRSPGRGRPGK